jgi:hypothetical protein
MMQAVKSPQYRHGVIETMPAVGPRVQQQQDQCPLQPRRAADPRTDTKTARLAPGRDSSPCPKKDNANDQPIHHTQGNILRAMS